jgi:hypothetical protein
VERESVERVGLEIHLDRLGELPHDGAVLLGDEIHAEAAIFRDQFVGEGLALDRYPMSFGSNDIWVTQFMVILLRRSPRASRARRAPTASSRGFAAEACRTLGVVT